MKPRRFLALVSRPPSKMIVIGKTVDEDTDWVGQELPE